MKICLLSLTVKPETQLLSQITYYLQQFSASLPLYKMKNLVRQNIYYI